MQRSEHSQVLFCQLAKSGLASGVPGWPAQVPPAETSPPPGSLHLPSNQRPRAARLFGVPHVSQRPQASDPGPQPCHAHQGLMVGQLGISPGRLSKGAASSQVPSTKVKTALPPGQGEKEERGSRGQCGGRTAPGNPPRLVLRTSSGFSLAPTGVEFIQSP